MPDILVNRVVDTKRTIGISGWLRRRRGAKTRPKKDKRIFYKLGAIT
jgi:hypothetical protein